MIDRFINADLIAAGLSPFAPEKELIAASRLFLREIEQCISRRESFSFETTLSGRSYLKLIRRLQADAWHVELVYLALPNKELSKLRVAERVSHGGHNIPEKDILRRFPRSLNNLLNLFSTVVDHCACFMNDRTPPKLIFENRNGSRIISDQDLYSHLLSESEV
ncbi:zeta toxin family protein [Hydrocarboniclastica marina]|uniref:zeta toxin family protein n=1 Tax=Hydrocarboniclastica marina TaxID=2259620 RepID=UPI001FECA89B|nr:zeta toxin family protein [Hydrocarboniclastica marina]